MAGFWMQQVSIFWGLYVVLTKTSARRVLETPRGSQRLPKSPGVRQSPPEASESLNFPFKRSERVREVPTRGFLAFLQSQAVPGHPSGGRVLRLLVRAGLVKNEPHQQRIGSVELIAVMIGRLSATVSDIRICFYTSFMR